MMIDRLRNEQASNIPIANHHEIISESKEGGYEMVSLKVSESFTLS